MKKILTRMFGSIVLMGLICPACFCHGIPGGSADEKEDFPRLGVESTSEGKTNLGDNIDVKRENSLINRLLTVFGLNSDALGGDHKFINYAKAIMNMALGLLSMVALIMSIYTFYMMFFTDNEAGAKKAKGNLIGIFIALAIIGLAWIIVSFIFWRYQSNWQSALPQN